MVIAIVLLVLLLLVLSFSFVLINGAPYLPTLKRQINAAIDLAKLKPGDTILELGCGDGRVLIAAAKAGLRGVGYELNPLMYLIARIRVRPYKDQIQVRWGDFWHKDWPKAELVYVFLLPRLMSRLEQNILARPDAPRKVISFAFEFADRKPAAEKDGVFLYRLN